MCYVNMGSKLIKNDDLLSITVWSVEDIKQAMKLHSVDITDYNLEVAIENITTDELDDCFKGNNHLQNEICGMNDDGYFKDEEAKT